jgi:alpha-ketoglutarate-dependent taurine dioxygenase
MYSVEQISLTGMDAASAFPRVFNASQPLGLEDTVAWVSQHQAQVESQLNQSGAVLLRGFGLATDMDFDGVIQAFDWPNFTYADSLSNAVRRNRTERVFTANEAPPDVSIFLHHEMAQTPIYPSKLLFFCEQPARQDGATPICRSDLLLTRLAAAAPEFVRACETKGVTYSQTMPSVDDLDSGQGRSWRSTLSADEPSAAEAKLRQLGYQWQWQDDGSLSVTTPVLPAVRELADGSRAFFNQLIAAFFGWQDARNQSHKAICFGDGSAIDGGAMALAIDLAEELTVELAWQRGDVAIVDNFRVMHGRRPFKGERRVLASLIA